MAVHEEDLNQSQENIEENIARLERTVGEREGRRGRSTPQKVNFEGTADGFRWS